jgi:hypothetical protein
MRKNPQKFRELRKRKCTTGTAECKTITNTLATPGVIYAVLVDFDCS